MNKKQWIFYIIIAALIIIIGQIIEKKVPGTGLNYISLVLAGVLIIGGLWNTLKKYLNK